MQTAKERLEYLRGEIEAERISYGELSELYSLREHIEPGDTLLLEWAGVTEYPADETVQFYDVRVAFDNTGPHLEYYATKADFDNDFGLPVDELEPESRERCLFDVRNGRYAGKP